MGCVQIKLVGRRRILSSVVVAPEHQGQGIGTAMIRALLSQEGDWVMLMCLRRLASYYSTFGFRQVSAMQAPSGLYWRLALLNLLGFLASPRVTVIIMLRPPRSQPMPGLTVV